MMIVEGIQALKESQTFDCKSIQIDPKALAIPFVAITNADGGVLAVGVSDKTRRIEGVDGNEKRLNVLPRVPFGCCNPSVKVRYEYLPCTDYYVKENRILLMHIKRPCTEQKDDMANIAKPADRQRKVYEAIKKGTINAKVPSKALGTSIIESIANWPETTNLPPMSEIFPAKSLVCSTFPTFSSRCGTRGSGR